ncbi:hypothetical protein SC206_07935 [Rouxiella sp. T17]
MAKSSKRVSFWRAIFNFWHFYFTREISADLQRQAFYQVGTLGFWSIQE